MSVPSEGTDATNANQSPPTRRSHLHALIRCSGHSDELKRGISDADPPSSSDSDSGHSRRVPEQRAGITGSAAAPALTLQPPPAAQQRELRR